MQYSYYEKSMREPFNPSFLLDSRTGAEEVACLAEPRDTFCVYLRLVSDTFEGAFWMRERGRL